MGVRKRASEIKTGFMVIAIAVIAVLAFGQSDDQRGAAPTATTKPHSAMQPRVLDPEIEVRRSDDFAFGSLSGEGEASNNAGNLVEIEFSTDQTVVFGDANDDSWTVSHSKSSQGSFVLLRNNSARVVSVTMDEVDPKSIDPGETVTWDCDASHRALVLQAETGNVIYSTDLECGDAVYVRQTFVDEL